MCKRAEYVGARWQQIQQRNLIYIDEKGWNLATRKSKGRALAGNSAQLTTVSKGKRVVLIAALTVHGIAHAELLHDFGAKKGTSHKKFEHYLIKLAGMVPQGSVL